VDEDCEKDETLDENIQDPASFVGFVSFVFFFMGSVAGVGVFV
jgi:hypothetical protein